MYKVNPNLNPLSASEFKKKYEKNKEVNMNIKKLVKKDINTVEDMGNAKVNLRLIVDDFVSKSITIRINAFLFILISLLFTFAHPSKLSFLKCFIAGYLSVSIMYTIAEVEIKGLYDDFLNRYKDTASWKPFNAIVTYIIILTMVVIKNFLIIRGRDSGHLIPYFIIAFCLGLLFSFIKYRRIESFLEKVYSVYNNMAGFYEKEEKKKKEFENRPKIRLDSRPYDQKKECMQKLEESKQKVESEFSFINIREMIPFNSPVSIYGFNQFEPKESIQITNTKIYEEYLQILKMLKTFENIQKDNSIDNNLKKMLALSIDINDYKVNSMRSMCEGIAKGFKAEIEMEKQLQNIKNVQYGKTFTKNGESVEIDCLILGNDGIHLIEVKNYSADEIKLSSSGQIHRTRNNKTYKVDVFSQATRASRNIKGIVGSNVDVYSIIAFVDNKTDIIDNMNNPNMRMMDINAVYSYFQNHKEDNVRTDVLQKLKTSETPERMFEFFDISKKKDEILAWIKRDINSIEKLVDNPLFIQRNLEVKQVRIFGDYQYFVDKQPQMHEEDKDKLKNEFKEIVNIKRNKILSAYNQIENRNGQLNKISNLLKETLDNVS